MSKKFPKNLFVKVEKDSNGPTEYFIADADITGMVEMGTKTKIATYALVDVVECEGVIKAHAPKRRR